MVEVSATAAAAIFPVNAFCLPLDDRGGLHTQNTCNVLDSEVIGQEYCPRSRARARMSQSVPETIPASPLFLDAAFTFSIFSADGMASASPCAHNTSNRLFERRCLSSSITDWVVIQIPVNSQIIKKERSVKDPSHTENSRGMP